MKRRRRGRREKGERRRENPYPYPNALFTSTDLLLPRNHLLVINLHYASFLLPPPLSPTILQPPPSSGRGIELPVSQEAGKVSVIVYYSSNGKAPQTSSSSTTAATLHPLLPSPTFIFLLDVYVIVLRLLSKLLIIASSASRYVSISGYPTIADFRGGVDSKVNGIIRIITNNWKARAATVFVSLP